MAGTVIVLGKGKSNKRPYEVVPEVFREMADESVRVNRRFLEIVTKQMVAAINQEGAKYRLRSGSTGRRFPLEASSDVRAFERQAGGIVVVGKVRGVPPGFWAIVEDGSRPHVISTRRVRGKEVRYTKGGAVRRNMGISTQTRRLMAGKGLGSLVPVRTPYGPRQWVMHPGHGPIGKPWAASMVRSEKIVNTELSAQQTAGLIKAWRQAA